MTTDFYEEPVLSLIGEMQFYEPPHLRVAWGSGVKDEIGRVSYWDDGRPVSDGERLVEFAGRLCYMSQDNPVQRRTTEYLNNIKAQGHGSVLEHATYSILLEGVSRSLTHELVRHRAGFAYSQLSQRYVNESDCAFVIPPALLKIGGSGLDDWKIQMLALRDCYQVLADGLFGEYTHIDDKVHRRKTAREAARSVLPNATETKIVVTANARAWRTMLELRTSEGAEAEIRRCMVAVLRILQTRCYGFFNDFEIYTAADGWEAARVSFHKV